MKDIIEKLINKKDLTGEEAGELLEGIMRGELSQVRAAMALTALRMKEESVEEIIGFIEVLRRNMLPVKGIGAVDVCGTGGDKKGTFNISTAVAFVLAAGGVKVAKHGNRAASSLCGSADVLEELGLKIDLKPDQAEKILAKTGMVFLFAQIYHPAYKPVGMVRKELGIPTVFNFLGPFINPASVKNQLVGISDIRMAEKMAEVASQMNYKHLLIVCGNEGLDEVSIFSPTTVFEVKGKKIKKYEFIPEKFGLKGAFDKILGGDAKTNARILKDIFKGKKGEPRDIVLVNSAFGFLAAGKVKDIKEGISLAEKLIDSGAAGRKVEEVVVATNKISNIKDLPAGRQGQR